MHQHGTLDNHHQEGPQSHKSLTLEDIWRAIELDQFFPYYQPKVKLRGMEPVGVEALMRWRHPERGVLSAGAFLPLIADNFLFDELAFIMLEKSVAQSRAWQKEGLDIIISVNMSPDLLHDTTLPDRIAAIVTEHCVPMQRLIIEVP
ncbi:MAG TPA: EAL domain-containing protein, partial [Burkholderiales bacterium]|nr:EAL domain-containing protein [Burkholderiales bacterium]